LTETGIGPTLAAAYHFQEQPMSILFRFKQGILIAATGAVLGVASAGSASAQQCPDWQLNGIPISTDAETAWVPQQYTMFAGGGLDLSQCGEIPGHGYITAAPNFSISYDARNMGRDLEFRVESACDTTLLINDATAQWSFNDDSNGLNPALRLSQAQSGRYDIWVGTYSNTPCQATLIAETFEYQPPVCPDWSLGGAQLNMVTGQNETRPVVAGGSVNMFDNQCGIQAHGYVAQAPDFSLYFDPQGQVSTLDISVQGNCDTLLLVNDPNTNWVFNDDSNDLQPRIEIGDAVAGRYDIWVGTFGASTCDATINVNAYAPGGMPPGGGNAGK